MSEPNARNGAVFEKCNISNVTVYGDVRVGTQVEDEDATSLPVPNTIGVVADASLQFAAVYSGITEEELEKMKEDCSTELGASVGTDWHSLDKSDVVKAKSVLRAMSLESSDYIVYQ